MHMYMYHRQPNLHCFVCFAFLVAVLIWRSSACLSLLDVFCCALFASSCLVYVFALSTLVALLEDASFVVLLCRCFAFATLGCLLALALFRVGLSEGLACGAHMVACARFTE